MWGSACESNFSTEFISSCIAGVIQVYDIFWFGVDSISSFLSVMHCVSTLEFCLERETAENHKTNIHWSIWNRISYNIALSEKNIYYKGSLKRQQFPVSGGISVWEKHFFLPLPSTCCMTLDRILKSVLYAIFCLSCQIRLCSVQGRACVLLCDSEKPSTGIIWPWIKCVGVALIWVKSKVSSGNRHCTVTVTYEISSNHLRKS